MIEKTLSYNDIKLHEKFLEFVNLYRYIISCIRGNLISYLDVKVCLNGCT